MSPRYAAKRDENQPEIVKALRAEGAYVECLHTVGGGFPDLYVEFGGLRTLMEVKMPGERLTERQERWHREHLEKTGRRVPIVYSVEDALAAVGAGRECA